MRLIYFKFHSFPFITVFSENMKNGICSCPFLVKIHEWNSVPRILSLVFSILQASFKTHCWSEKRMFKRKLNLKSQQCHYKNLFPKNKCTQCGSISSPKDNFHFNFLRFLTLNQFSVLCDFLFVNTDYKSMYLLLICC